MVPRAIRPSALGRHAGARANGDRERLRRHGYTTLAQADLIADQLRLVGGDWLLDVGAGRGWPGLYLSKVTGCSVVLTDLPEEGLRSARRRAGVEGIGDRVTAIAGSARRLPFVHESFDAIVHTDVLC